MGGLRGSPFSVEENRNEYGSCSFVVLFLFGWWGISGNYGDCPMYG